MLPPDVVNLDDLERLAAERLEPAHFDYLAGGAGDERTLRANRAAFGRRWLLPRALVDVSAIDLRTVAVGAELEWPVIVAPTALHRLAHAEGEAASARGAAAAGTLFTLSTLSSASVEEVAAAAPDAPRWFQLYTGRDRSAAAALVERVVAAGYGAVVVTVDVPVVGRRERDIRHRFAVPADVRLANIVDPRGDHEEFGVMFSRFVDPSLSWTDLEWLRDVCPVPLIVKGVVRADDARRAVELGADGVWVSNHGGRQLDGAIATLDALPAVAAEVGAAATIVVDGGVRRGSDALIALALGADLVAVGRPPLWGLAIGGAAGVTAVLLALRNELEAAMALAGCRALDEVTPDLLAGPPVERPPGSVVDWSP